MAKTKAKTPEKVVETPAKAVAAKKTAAKEVAVKETPAKTAAVKTAPVKEAAIKTAAVKAAPVKETAVKVVAEKAAPVKEAAKTATIKAAPAKAAPTKEVAVKVVAEKAAPAKEAVAKEVSVFEQLEKLGHEQVVYCSDPESGLKAIIGIHNTVLGPALGGTRMWAYKNEADALNDVLRLSRGMSFKNSIAGLSLGGGKAVIIGDARTQKTEALLRAFGNFVRNLNGKYITAEDIGMTAADIENIGKSTKHVTGMPETRGGNGDPSPFTAYGVYMGMKAAAKKAYGSDSLQGKTVAVQGVGHVGEYLVKHLSEEGCKVFISDVYEDRLKEVSAKYKAKVIGLDEIYGLKMDIYAPCALGATVNDDTLAKLQCQIIAGAANNQLKDEKIHGDACAAKGIIYAPDFLINAGGVINCYAEIAGYSSKWVQGETEKLYERTMNVLTEANDGKSNTQEVAIKLALKRISDVAKTKASF